MKTLCIFIVFACLAVAVTAQVPAKAGYAVQVNGLTNRYTIYSVFVLPGAPVTIRSSQTLTVTGPGTPRKTSGGGWRISAPEQPGAYQATISTTTGHPMTLNVLVLVPATQKEGEYLNGYRIGRYRGTVSKKGSPLNKRPLGFFEVTAANLGLQLTPHFTVGQFVSRQKGGYPKYVVVREQLLLKLEYLLQQANKAGIPAEGFRVKTGYNTPYINGDTRIMEAIRHAYGTAADIIVDADGDGLMDDVNQDGVVNKRDVQLVLAAIKPKGKDADARRYNGGLNAYKPKKGKHQGFIHVDLRGWQ